MTTPAELTDAVPGRPDDIARAVDELADAARRWGAVHDAVIARVPALTGAWRGSLAATGAQARVHSAAVTAGRAAQACRAVVGPLRAFADELRQAQADWAGGAAMVGGAGPSVDDGANVQASAVDRARVANEDAAQALRAAAASLADLVPAATTPQVVGQDDGTFGQGVWNAGADAVRGMGALLGGTVDRLDPFGDRFGRAWASTAETIAAAVTHPLAAAESAVEGLADPIVTAYRHGGADEASGRALGAIALAAGTRGLSEARVASGIGGFSAASRVDELPGPPPGWRSSVERGPHTPLAPGGGLQRHEEAGGHTLRTDKAHVGASDDEMLARQATQRRPSRVSTYFDPVHGEHRALAERCVNESILANQQRIHEWLSSDDGAPLRLDHVHDAPIGRSAPRLAAPDQIAEVNKSRTVLEKDPSMAEGYRILTSFPDP